MERVCIERQEDKCTVHDCVCVSQLPCCVLLSSSLSSSMRLTWLAAVLCSVVFQSVIFNEIDLVGCSVAECSLKTFNVTFQVSVIV